MTVAANTDDVLILVNKYNYLSKDYTPSDLESIDSKYNKGANNSILEVRESNMNAIKLYSKFGYKTIGYIVR